MDEAIALKLLKYCWILGHKCYKTEEERWATCKMRVDKCNRDCLIGRSSQTIGIMPERIERGPSNRPPWSICHECWSNLKKTVIINAYKISLCRIKCIYCVFVLCSTYIKYVGIFNEYYQTPFSWHDENFHPLYFHSLTNDLVSGIIRIYNPEPCTEILST